MMARTAAPAVEYASDSKAVRCLSRVYSDGETVSPATLSEKGLIKGQEEAKILSDGELTKKLVIEGVKVSAAAAEKIKAAGGEVR